MAGKGDVASIAEAELGYLEKSMASWNKYGTACLYDKTKYAGDDNVQKYAWETGHYKSVGWSPWCMTFVVWVFMSVFGKDKANELLCGTYNSASTMATKDKMLGKGRQVSLDKAEKGDIVFRSRKGGGHVGIVVGRTASGKIITVEGNSSSDDITSWNGGAVVKHVGASWEWCCRPDWSVLGWHWVPVGYDWYYQDPEGRNTYGWKVIQETNGTKKHWYHFDTRGKMDKGEVEVNGNRYFLMSDGPLEGACCKTDESGALYVWDV